MFAWGQRSKVKGQKNINHQSDVFAIQLSSEQVSRGWGFSQSGFEGLGFQTIRLWVAGVSANQVWGASVRPIISFQCSIFLQSGLRGWGFRQSGFEWLGFQPIRFRGAAVSVNQVSRGRSSANHIISASYLCPIRFGGLRFQPIRSFWLPSLVESNFFRPWIAPITFLLSTNSLNQFVFLSNSERLAFFTMFFVETDF